MTTDAWLVARAKGGDDDAFDQLVVRHQRVLYRLAIRLTGNRADAEDVLQDVFFQAFRRLKSFRGDSQFGTWLYRIAVNAALMRRRQSRRTRADPLETYLPQFRSDGRHRRIDVDYSAASRIEALVQRRELKKLLLDAITRLPGRYRAAVVLCDLEELPAREAARVLRVDERAVRQRVHRARLMLRGYLDVVAQGVER